MNKAEILSFRLFKPSQCELSQLGMLVKFGADEEFKIHLFHKYQVKNKCNVFDSFFPFLLLYHIFRLKKGR